jgi:hypothetical protein
MNKQDFDDHVLSPEVLVELRVVSSRRLKLLLLLLPGAQMHYLALLPQLVFSGASGVPRVLALL